jgi:Fe-Mn family superoxide dismutase
MQPTGHGDPQGPIAEVSGKTFGSFKNFQSKINDAGAKQFGSGWVGLTSKSKGDAQIITTSHREPDLLRAVSDRPWGHDLWEHAYISKTTIAVPSSWRHWSVVNWKRSTIDPTL